MFDTAVKMEDAWPAYPATLFFSDKSSANQVENVRDMGEYAIEDSAQRVHENLYQSAKRRRRQNATKYGNKTAIGIRGCPLGTHNRPNQPGRTPR